MSSYAITVDMNTLPDALLEIAKKHMRVDFDDDDSAITIYLQAAINLFENHSGWRVFGGQALWTPTLLPNTWSYPCPTQPISDFSVMSGGTDTSAEYRLDNAYSLTTQVWLTHIDKTPFPADAEVTLLVGYDDPALMPPMALNLILRIAAHFYEHRESVDTSGLMMIPQWMNDLLLAHWIPRC